MASGVFAPLLPRATQGHRDRVFRAYIGYTDVITLDQTLLDMGARR